MPYNSPTLVGEIDENGRRRLFREQFDTGSWSALPSRIPVVRAHDREKPIAWGELDNRGDGLIVTLDYLDGSTSAADARAEVRAGVLRGLSVAFVEDPGSDVVERGRGGTELPLIRRRNARLHEVSLVSRPAYPGATIFAADLDRWQHEQSEKVLVPYRAEQEQKRAEQRRADAELLDRIDRQASVRWVGAALSATESDRAGRAVGITPARVADAFLVRTGGGVAVRVQRRTAVVETESDAIAWVEDSRRIAESLAATHRIPIGETMARLGVEVP